MSSALRQAMSMGEFLAWETTQEDKFEFDGLAVHAMVGATPAHAAIQVNLIAALSARLRGGPCRVWGSDCKLRLADRIRYPDAFITCSAIDWTAPANTAPVVVFEIVSPSTERTDRFVKTAEYRQMPSIQAYVILQQSFIGATVYTRTGDDWVGREHAQSAVLTLPGAGIEVPLDELYDGIPLSA